MIGSPSPRALRDEGSGLVSVPMAAVQRRRHGDAGRDGGATASAALAQSRDCISFSKSSPAAPASASPASAAPAAALVAADSAALIAFCSSAAAA
eukprot:jgi/Chrpa1/5886/Chrysochromulina_OHIO_Genome00009845-RA